MISKTEDVKELTGTAIGPVRTSMMAWYRSAVNESIVSIVSIEVLKLRTRAASQILSPWPKKQVWCKEDAAPVVRKHVPVLRLLRVGNLIQKGGRRVWLEQIDSWLDSVETLAAIRGKVLQ